MKNVIVFAVALISSSTALANPDLQMALQALGQAKFAISQGQSQRATNAILQAESNIYRAMGGGHLPNPRAWLCQFSYRGKSYEGRGQSEQEARNMLTNNCMRQSPDLSSICDDFANNPYTTTCVERSF